MSVYDMIGRIESGMSVVEVTSLDSHGNKSDVMEMDLRYFHGPDNHLYWNGAVELGDYVIDCVYQKVEDDLFLENDELHKVYDKAVVHLNAAEGCRLHGTFVTKVLDEYSKYEARIAQLDAELA